MLYPVIQRVSAETGIDLVQQRSTLVDYFNQASRIFHAELDANKMYREVTLVVPADKVVSLPSFIGEVKGIRIHSTEILVPLQSINVPRYSNSTLVYKIKNWRDLGNSPILRNLTVIAPFTLTCAAVEDEPAVVKICGQTNAASKLEEEITLNATSVTTTNQFGPQIFSIASFSARDNDITITDNLGVVVAVLGNKEQKTRYKLIDVSQIFWPLNDTAGGDSFIDVCYKLPFILAKNDTDSFAGGDDYDEAIYHMMLHLNYMTLGGKEQMALAELTRATQLLKAMKDGSEPGIQHKLNWGRNKYYGLFLNGRNRMGGNDYGIFDDMYNVDRI